MFFCDHSIAQNEHAKTVPVINFLLEENGCEQTFSSNATFVVPPNIAEIELTLIGGEGGNGGGSDTIFVVNPEGNITIDSDASPGFGALGELVTSSIAVTSGQVFSLVVGQGGGGGEHAPFGGDGGIGGQGDPIGQNGGNGTGNGGSGGGGGAGGTTSVVSGLLRITAAGGTGGGGASRNVTGNGENGTDGGGGGLPDGGDGGQGVTGTGQNTTFQIFQEPNESLSGNSGSILVSYCKD